MKNITFGELKENFIISNEDFEKDFNKKQIVSREKCEEYFNKNIYK